MVLPYLKAIFLYACFDSEEIKTSLYQVTIAFVAAFLKEDKVTLRKRKTKEKTGNSSDIVIRHFKIGVNNSLAAAIVYIEGIVDNQSIQDYLLQSLMKDNQKTELND